MSNFALPNCPWLNNSFMYKPHKHFNFQRNFDCPSIFGTRKRAWINNIKIHWFNGKLSRPSKPNVVKFGHFRSCLQKTIRHVSKFDVLHCSEVILSFLTWLIECPNFTKFSTGITNSSILHKRIRKLCGEASGNIVLVYSTMGLVWFVIASSFKTHTSCFFRRTYLLILKHTCSFSGGYVAKLPADKVSLFWLLAEYERLQIGLPGLVQKSLEVSNSTFSISK